MANDTVNLVDIGQLWNCEFAFENECPRKWTSLAETSDERTRYCDTCNQDVTLCETPDEFVTLGNSGRCVAIPERQAPMTLQMMQMGRPSTESMREFERKQESCRAWWSTVLSHNPTFEPAAMLRISEGVRASAQTQRVSEMLRHLSAERES